MSKDKCNLFSCPVTTNYIFVNVTRVGSWVKILLSESYNEGQNRTTEM